MINKELPQEQIELFSDSADSNRKNAGRTREDRSIVVAFDSCIIASIVIILVVLLAFSLGVEKGKRLNLVTATQDISQKIPQAITKEQPALKASQAPVAEKNKATETNQPANIVKAQDKPLGQNKTAGNKYTVQIASYTKSVYAENEAKILKKDGYETFIFSKGKYTALCVGTFLDKAQANLSLEKLKRRYLDCYVRRL